MAKDIPRATLRQLVREYKANGLFRPSRNGVVAYANSLLIYNVTNSTIPVGGAIKVSGFPASISFDAAIGKLINGELALNGIASGSGDDSSVIATALDPIPAGQIGRVQANGIAFARIHYNPPASGDSEYSQASATFELVKNGVFQILASSQKNASNYMICAVNRIAGSGGGNYNTRTLSFIYNFTVNSSHQLTFNSTSVTFLTPAS
ncbi:MAG: hypothetical protein IKX88_07350 [Thermoguttaceae bacterium]|nr:hypothetical protein [Thermoguttaceae bacterium]